MALEDNINVIINDQSIRVDTGVSNKGFTVIRSSKGREKPILFPKKSDKLIRTIYGDYGSDYPDIWEAVKYNEKYPLWISAPANGGTYGGVYVTKQGVLPLDNGIVDITTLNLSAISVTEQVGIGNGADTNFTLTTSKYSYYNNTTVDILVDTVSIAVTATDAEPEVLTSTELASGTYTRATGALDITFNVAPVSDAVIEVTYTINMANDLYFILTNNAPQADDKAIFATEKDGILSLSLYQKNNKGTYSLMSGYPKQVSMDRQVRGDNNAYIEVTKVFEDDSYFSVIKNTAITVIDTFVDSTTQDLFTQGSRGNVLADSDIKVGFDYLQEKDDYEAKFIFDVTGLGGAIISTFTTLRSTYQKYSQYLFPLSNDTESNVITEKQTLALNNRGLWAFWAWAEVDNALDSGDIMITSLVGAIASKHADTSPAFYGLQASGIDSNGIGGNLEIPIIKMLSKPTDIQTLKDNRINYVTFSKNYGLYIETDLTSVILNSDFTNGGPSRLADYIIEIGVEQILPPQVDKPNSPSNRARVKTLFDQVLIPINGSIFEVMQESGAKCDAENNGDDVLAREEFVVDVFVKFAKFSKTINFFFNVVEQNVNVEELL